VSVTSSGRPAARAMRTPRTANASSYRHTLPELLEKRQLREPCDPLVGWRGGRRVWRAEPEFELGRLSTAGHSL
jgi:hypothetical protein